MVITLTAGRRGLSALWDREGAVGVETASERALMLRVVVATRDKGVVEKQGV